MNFEELGLILKEERERRGLTIEAVMEATKISRTNIVGMENGNRDALPHPVYAKGFIKSYARYLGLDANELSMVVDHEFQGACDGPEEKIYEVSRAAEKAFHDRDCVEVRKHSKWPFVLVAILLVGIAFLLYLNFGNNAVQSEVSSQSQIQEEKSVALATSSENSQNDQQALMNDQNDDTQEGEAAVAAEDGNSAAKLDSTLPAEDSTLNEDVALNSEQPEQVSTVEESVNDLADDADENTQVVKKENNTLDAVEKQKYDHIVIIRATSEKGCWIGLWKGDSTKMARDFVLKEGEPLRLMFNTPRRIRIGNVAGVTVTYNGTPYALDATSGNIQTLSFGSN